MWIITEIGFFNIIQQDDDEAKGLLTVKARSREDIKKFRERIITPLGWAAIEIEESPVTDYRFRLKTKRSEVVKVVTELVEQIDYGKTKPAISAQYPERAGVYLDVWDILYAIQEQESSQGG